MRSWRPSETAQAARAQWAKAQSAAHRFFNAPPEELATFSAAQLLIRGPQSMRTHVMLIIAFSAAINLFYLAPSLYML